MKLTHRLLAALLAALVIAAGLIGGVLYARSVESRYVHALAPQLEHISLIGSALQRVALRQPDLLLVYGGSEVALGADAEGYAAPEVFRTYPTGFAPFAVAHVGVTSLVMAECVGALGPDLRGQKVIISFTPTQFFSDKVAVDGYVGLFSRLHANELIFSTQLGLDIKQAAARRMLVFPASLDKEPLLRFALERLAGGSPLDLALYYAVWPLGKLWTTVLELQDHWEVLAYVRASPALNPDVPRAPAAVDWAALKARAEQEQMADADNNPYGIDNELWQGQQHTTRAPGSIDQIAMGRLRDSPEWTDFDILLHILTDMGARPLILSRPVNVLYWESMGISSAVGQAYYDKLNQVAQRYGVPVVDFHEYSQDKYFNADSVSHASQKGWVYVDEVMDAFYHDRPPE